MKAELVPENGDPPIPITRDVVLVGRREYCDVVIDHSSLSKRHCLLVKTDGLLVVRDLISTNGTKVKGQKVRWAALLPDDRITLGATSFVFTWDPTKSLALLSFIGHGSSARLVHQATSRRRTRLGGKALPAAAARPDVAGSRSVASCCRGYGVEPGFSRALASGYRCLLVRAGHHRRRLPRPAGTTTSSP